MKPARQIAKSETLSTPLGSPPRGVFLWPRRGSRVSHGEKPFYLETPDDVSNENGRRDQSLDARILQQAQSGDERAIETVLRRVTPRLLPLARHLTANPTAAEELVEDALYRGALKLKELRHAHALNSWFRTILLRLWRDALRRSARERKRGDRPLDSSDDSILPAAPRSSQPEAIAEATETHDLIARAIDELPPLQRAVVKLTFESSLSVSEIAAVLETSADRVKANLWHARHRLRGRLKGIVGNDID